MAKPSRLVLEAYGEFSLEPRQYVKWMAWLIFTTLSSILYNFAL